MPTDYLDEDTPIPGQEFASVSFTSADNVQKSTIPRVRIGYVGTSKQVDEHIASRSSKKFHEYKLQVGYWCINDPIPVILNKAPQELDRQMQKVMECYNISVIKEKTDYEERKRRLKAGDWECDKCGAFSPDADDTCSKCSNSKPKPTEEGRLDMDQPLTKVTKVPVSVSPTVETPVLETTAETTAETPAVGYEEVDMADVESDNPLQRFVCVSMVYTHKDWVDEYGLDIRGLIKIRGVYPDMESAKRKADSLRKLDERIVVNVGPVGRWLKNNPDYDDFEEEVDQDPDYQKYADAKRDENSKVKQHRKLMMQQDAEAELVREQFGTQVNVVEVDSSDLDSSDEDIG